MWNIHGKTYNLKPFLHKHPGGKAVLEACMGNDDLTPIFESYHAFSNMSTIKSIMKNYEVCACQPSKTLFATDGFYRTLQKRVINQLKNNTKADIYLIFKILVQTSLFVVNFYYVFFYSKIYTIDTIDTIDTIYRILSAIAAGHMLVQVGLCAMHDASHMAITKNPIINEFISNIWNAIALWDSQLWCYHHVIRHHAFTGDIDKDPDIIHFKPFIRKSREISSNKYLNISKKFPITTAILTTCIFPGMFIGQGFLYNIVWLKKKKFMENENTRKL